ncbi:uncharacterized protein LOC121837543 [Ixodes scapularis]|uniref:uncharacterized protein LOC121837543 n=1 Tax=Ixodes scapularis TaxID=6945 RepID=UPI001A9DF8AF|nr:uncharacterized protein LOC121837543 [Ixodes scapularis]
MDGAIWQGQVYDDKRDFAADQAKVRQKIFEKFFMGRPFAIPYVSEYVAKTVGDQTKWTEARSMPAVRRILYDVPSIPMREWSRYQELAAKNPVFERFPQSHYQVYFFTLLLRIFTGTPVPPNDWILALFLVNAVTPSAVHVVYSPNCKGTSVAATPWACYFDSLEVPTFCVTGTVFTFKDGEVRDGDRIRLTRGPPLLWYPMYVATRDEEITLDAPFLTVPFTFSSWLQHKGRIIDIQTWFKVTGAEMATLYESTYRCNHKGGFVGNLLRLCYRFLMYAEPGGGDNSNILVYTELSDQRVAVKLHDLNWFASSDNDRSQDYVVSELSVDALFTESSLEEKVAASTWPYVPETNRKADHAFRPNKLLRSCVRTVFRDIFEKSRDVRSADIRNIATPVRLMSFYEFVIARLVPTLTKYGVDTHAKVNRHFWATAVDAVISAYALGDPEKPSRYDEWMRYSRFYVAFTGTFWGMDPRAWSRAEWFAFVRNPHGAMSTYYGFLRPDRVIVQVLGPTRVGLCPESREELMTAVDQILPPRYVYFLRHLLPVDTLGHNMAAVLRAKDYDAFQASLDRLDWLKEKCLQVYVQTFYYKSRNIDKKVTFSKLKYSFRSSSDYPDWLSVIEFEVPRADALNAARVVWTAIARLRSVVEVGLRFEMLPHVEPYLGRFARNYFTREEAELLSGSDYTNLNLRDDEFMDFLFHSKGKVTCTEVFSNEEEEGEEEERPRRKRSVLSPGEGRPKGSAVLTERLAQGLFAIAVEMSRGNSDGVHSLVETYVPYKTNSLRLTYDSRDDEWSLSRRSNGRYSKLEFDFHVERESALRPATIRDVICEMAMGNLETFSAFALKLFDVHLEKGNDYIAPNPWILEAPARMGTNPLRECQTVTARDLVDMNVFTSAEVAATYLGFTTDSWAAIARSIDEIPNRKIFVAPGIEPYGVPLEYVLLRIRKR